MKKVFVLVIVVIIILLSVIPFMIKISLPLPYTDIHIGDSLNKLRKKGFAIYGEQGLDLYRFNLQHSKANLVANLPVKSISLTTSSFHGVFARIESIDAIYTKSITFDNIYNKLISLYGKPKEVTSRQDKYHKFTSKDNNSVINRYLFYDSGYNIVLIQCDNMPIRLSIYPTKRAAEVLISNGVFISIDGDSLQNINNGQIILQLILPKNVLKIQNMEKQDNRNVNYISELVENISYKDVVRSLCDNTRVDSRYEINDKLNDRVYRQIYGYYEPYKIRYEAIIAENINLIVINNHFIKETRDAIHI